MIPTVVKLDIPLTSPVSFRHSTTASHSHPSALSTQPDAFVRFGEEGEKKVSGRRFLSRGIPALLIALLIVASRINSFAAPQQPVTGAVQAPQGPYELRNRHELVIDGVRVPLPKNLRHPKTEADLAAIHAYLARIQEEASNILGNNDYTTAKPKYNTLFTTVVPLDISLKPEGTVEKRLKARLNKDNTISVKGMLKFHFTPPTEDDFYEFALPLNFAIDRLPLGVISSMVLSDALAYPNPEQKLAEWITNQLVVPQFLAVAQNQVKNANAAVFPTRAAMNDDEAWDRLLQYHCLIYGTPKRGKRGSKNISDYTRSDLWDRVESNLAKLNPKHVSSNVGFSSPREDFKRPKMALIDSTIKGAPVVKDIYSQLPKASKGQFGAPYIVVLQEETLTPNSPYHAVLFQYYNPEIDYKHYSTVEGILVYELVIDPKKIPDSLKRKSRSEQAQHLFNTHFAPYLHLKVSAPFNSSPTTGINGIKGHLENVRTDILQTSQTTFPGVTLQAIAAAISGEEKRRVN